MFNYTHRTLNDAIEAGNVVVHASAEFWQDAAMILAHPVLVRAPIAEDTAADWCNLYQVFETLDLDAVREKYDVQFEREDAGQHSYVRWSHEDDPRLS